jgi:hypothetical protein
LTPNQIRLHERAVELIWEYAEITGAHAAEAVILQLLQPRQMQDRIAALQRLCVFWRISSK